MRMREEFAGVWQLTRLGAFNCHLVADGGALTLIDTGLPGSAPGILDAARRIGLPLGRVLVTHAHLDHLGSLDALAEARPELPVFASARSASLMAGQHGLLEEEAGRPLRGSFLRTATAPSATLAEGDRIGGFRVIATPGHAPGHLAFLHEPTGCLFAGDAVQTAGGRLAVSGDLRLLLPFPALATWDRGLAPESARRLLLLRTAGLLCGHGPSLPKPAAVLAIAIAEAEEALGARQGVAASAETRPPA